MKKLYAVNILITGANGYLGYQVVYELLKSDEISSITAVVRNIELNKNIFPPRVRLLSSQELLNNEKSFENIDVVCHLASGRPIHTPHDIAAGLEFTNSLIVKIINSKIKLFINASSLVVYGQQPLLWSENSKVAPLSIHAEAKWASELMTKNIALLNPDIQTTSLRFTKLIGPSNNFKFVDEFPHIFSKNALIEKPTVINNAAERIYDLMDVRDASKVVLKIILNTNSLPQVLNVGANVQLNLLEIAKYVSDISQQLYNKPLLYKLVNDYGKSTKFGMDSNLLKETFKFEPTYTIQQTIEDTLFFLNKALKK